MKMKAAFAAWNGRIAPVFDVAERIRIFEVEDGRVVRETALVLSGDHPDQKARTLIDTGAEVLVCGAISRILHDRITAGGIRIIPFIAGELTEIMQAWLRGELQRDAYAMPGCCGRRRRGLKVGPGKDEEVMRKNGGGRGTGGGFGLGGSRGGGRGRGNGPRAAGPGGECVCSKCGHAEPHQRGVQCFERKCPKCGSVMTRR